MSRRESGRSEAVYANCADEEAEDILLSTKATRIELYIVWVDSDLMGL